MSLVDSPEVFMRSQGNSAHDRFDDSATGGLRGYNPTETASTTTLMRPLSGY
jgi:hypothetical protein